nr:CoA transferase [Mycolicibacterium sp. P9-22]
MADAFTTHTGVRVDAAGLLTGRAALLGLTAKGQISAGGATRILRGADTWCAFTLSRPDDIAALPALIEVDDVAGDPWPLLQRWVSTRPAAAAVERARLLGLPAAVLGEVTRGHPVTRPHGPRGRRSGRLLVVDMSSMWAGPLCGQLLRGADATVIKVESPRRTDGTRAGSAAFYDWMNRGKLSYALEFDDRAAMLRLLGAADVVIEGSRPASLIRRGLGPGDIAPRAGRIWCRISGYGSDGDAGTRVAFGDDAAVAGGLVGSGPEGPVFVGDAIADPLTGLHAASAVAESLTRGGGELIELSMAATAAGYTRFVEGPLREPITPASGASASPLGADDTAVRALLDERHSVSC